MHLLCSGPVVLRALRDEPKNSCVRDYSSCLWQRIQIVEVVAGNRNSDVNINNNSNAVGK